MPENHTGRVVSGTLIRGLLRAAESAGANVEPIMSSLDIEPADLEPWAVLPQHVECALWSELVASDPAIGARAGVAWKKGAFRVLEYLVRTSTNLREGFAVLVRFHAFLHGAPVYEVVGDCLRYRSPHRGEPFQEAATEFALASLVHLARDCSGLEHVASELRLPHSAREGSAHLAAIAPLRHGAEHAEVCFRSDALDAHLESADAELHTLLRELALHRLEARPDEGLIATVRRLVEESLPDEPRVVDVARRLDLGQRTLQERLQERDTSFREIVDDVRKELALRYLRRAELDVTDVAMLLGYSDARAFHRAFKRWTGETPGRYR